MTSIYTHSDSRIGMDRSQRSGFECCEVVHAPAWAMEHRSKTEMLANVQPILESKCVYTPFDHQNLTFPREDYLPVTAPRPPIPSYKNQGYNERRDMCYHVVEVGGCPYGSHCHFAHCAEEISSLFQKHFPNYKRDLCANFFAKGVCYYGPKCRFSHSLSYAHELGYVYEASIGAYVRGTEILSASRGPSVRPAAYRRPHTTLD